MKTASARLCHINNSRRATYGYDQRIEVHGSKGRLRAENPTATTVEFADGGAVTNDKPLHFSRTRCRQADGEHPVNNFRTIWEFVRYAFCRNVSIVSFPLRT